MGATCLVHWKDANGQQSLSLLSDRLLKQFHANPIGRWNINWKVFRDISPVSKSGTGKMMHIVHVQGGATARGVPPGSQSANPGATVATLATGGSGSLGATAQGTGTGIGAGANTTGAGKTGLGILATGGVQGSTVGGSGPGGPGGASSAGLGSSAGEGLSSSAWCLIDEGTIGVASSPAGQPSTLSGEVVQRKAVLVEVEKDIEVLVGKLKNLWVTRQHAQVEGHIFDLGDFIVRAGNIMVASTSYKGILIEIEYLPQTSSATASSAIFEEFVREISPPNVTLYTPQMLDYPYEQVGLDPNSWSMLHSGFQYMTLFRRQHIL